MNAFEVFKLPISVEIDLVNLRKAYIQQQQNAHPDHGGDILDSEQINKAYTILKVRENRIKLILELNQIETNDSSTLPPGFLFEMMEISEMMEAEHHESIKAKIDELMQISDAEFSEIHSEESIKKLAVWYQKNKYYNRLEKNSKGIQEI
jgi:glutamine synthetase adenylyltransferase